MGFKVMGRMPFQNPWSMTKNLSSLQKKALILTEVISHVMQVISGATAGAAMAWYVDGGQQLVNFHHLLAGVFLFVVSALLGDRNVFKRNYLRRMVAYRVITAAAFLPLALMKANYTAVVLICLTDLLNPVQNGYRADRVNIIWGHRKESLSEKQNYNLRMYPITTAVVALGGGLGIAWQPSATQACIALICSQIFALVLDIVRKYRYLDKIEAEEEEKEGK